MKNNIKGLLLAVFISLCAYMLAQHILIGSVAIAIIIGILIGNIVKLNDSYSSGITYAEKTLLAYAIALMGIDLDFTILSSLGFKTIFIIVIGMVITIYSAVLVSRYYGIDKKLGLLLGIGNGVCGSSAISATAPIVKAEKNHIGISVAIVNLLGTIGIFLLPFLALSFGLSDIEAGILVGNTLQAVGQVTAAGFSISDTAGVSATAVKMGRVLLLTPLVLILIYIYHKNTQDNEGEVKKAKVPGFILVFVALSIISSLGVVPVAIKEIISSMSHILLIIAMAAVGLKIHFSSIKADGKIALKIATIVFVIQLIVTLGFLKI